MKSFWPLRKTVRVSSLIWRDSRAIPGVRFAIRKASLGQRIDLTSRIRELTIKNDFLRAGEITDELEATQADLMVQRLYLEWALAEVEGLRLDGRAATPDLVVGKGPVELVREIAEAVRAEIELSEDERKNF